MQGGGGEAEARRGGKSASGASGRHGVIGLDFPLVDDERHDGADTMRGVRDELLRDGDSYIASIDPGDSNQRGFARASGARARRGGRRHP